MAQFIPANKQFVPTQQVGSQVLGQPVVLQQQPVVLQQQPVVFSSQILSKPPVVFLPQVIRQAETDQLLRKESNVSLRLRKFLFYAPAVFFLVLLVFSSVIYGLRFEKSNGTTPAAAQVLINLGESYSANPILELRVLPKYKLDNVDNKKILNTCADLETIKATIGADYWNNAATGAPTAAGTLEPKAVLDRFEEVTFDTFQQIQEGCVCTVQKYGRTKLSYHDVDYCEAHQDCQRVKDSNSVQENILFGSLFCVRRVKNFLWKKADEQCNAFTFEGQKMRECGPNFCVSSEEGLYKDEVYSYQSKGLCPISKIQIVSKTATCTAGSDDACYLPASANYASKSGDNTREIIHFRNRQANDASTAADAPYQKLQILTWREYTNRPVINLKASISSPQCLSSDLQRPLRATHRSYKLQQTRETGCWPFGAHIAKDNSDRTATYLNVYTGLKQNIFLNENEIYYNNIPFYKDYIMSDTDLVNIYAEVRPNVDQRDNEVVATQNNCRDNGIQDISVRAKNSIQVLDVVEYYSFALIISSFVGLVASVVFVALRNKNFVTSRTQFYLHLFVLVNGVALFVFACVFWNYVNRYNTAEIEKQLFYQFENNCYMYDGQVDASKHLWDLIKYINNQIFGLITFLFVFDVFFFAAVVASVVLRRKEQLVICQPLKSEGLYYE